MPRSLPLLAIAIALASCGSSSARSGGGSSPARCGQRHGQTLAASRLVRVYSFDGGAYGCAEGRRKSYRLGSATRSLKEPTVGAVAVAGEDAAYALVRHGIDTVSTSVVVRRLTDGKQLSSFPSVTGMLGPEFLQSVDSIVVKSEGAVAWIGVGGSLFSHRQNIEVHIATGGKSSLLDSSGAIDPHSLRLHGSRLTWKHGGAVRSARLR